jgi:cell division protein FtsI (penicillin-binding protein 3)
VTASTGLKQLVTFTAAIDSGRSRQTVWIRSLGTGRPIRNAEQRAYGNVTARQALAKSINVVAAEVCLDMGSEVFYRYIRLFGFGKPTEVDLNYESEGIVKGPSNRYWSQYDQAANSFGQGISATALQMLNAVAAIRRLSLAAASCPGSGKEWPGLPRAAASDATGHQA